MVTMTPYNANKPIYADDWPEDTLFFLDFDGVIACQLEEKLFRLPADLGERERLEQMADKIGISHHLYESTGYLRHLIFQAISAQPVNRHPPVIHLMRELQVRDQPYFVVTSRSGFWAVERMMDLLREEKLTPQEVFCLGRASKADLLAKLRGDWPDRPFVFIEDSQHHIDDALKLDDPKLEIIQMVWDKDQTEAEVLRQLMTG